MALFTLMLMWRFSVNKTIKLETRPKVMHT